MTTTLPPAPPPALTTRETEVLALLAAGHDQPAIAAHLWISVDTVKTHTMRARRKMGARNSTHAVAIAIRAGLIA